jgi:hypothetical protein
MMQIPSKNWIFGQRLAAHGLGLDYRRTFVTIFGCVGARTHDRKEGRLEEMARGSLGSHDVDEGVWAVLEM